MKINGRAGWRFAGGSMPMQVPRILIVPTLVLAALLGPALTPASAAHAEDVPSFWEKSQLMVGAGGTYHFWSEAHSVVIPVTLLMDDNRFELGVFRMADAQSLHDDYTHTVRQTANPYWGASLSRRWQLAGGQRWKLFVGFGASYKTEENDLSATHWNFASQLGVRIALQPRRAYFELAIRHW